MHIALRKSPATTAQRPHCTEFALPRLEREPPFPVRRRVRVPRDVGSRVFDASFGLAADLHFFSFFRRRPLLRRRLRPASRLFSTSTLNFTFHRSLTRAHFRLGIVALFAYIFLFTISSPLKVSDRIFLMYASYFRRDRYVCGGSSISHCAEDRRVAFL